MKKKILLSFFISILVANNAFAYTIQKPNSKYWWETSIKEKRGIIEYEGDNFAITTYLIDGRTYMKASDICEIINVEHYKDDDIGDFSYNCSNTLFYINLGGDSSKQLTYPLQQDVELTDTVTVISNSRYNLEDYSYEKRIDPDTLLFSTPYMTTFHIEDINDYDHSSPKYKPSDPPPEHYHYYTWIEGFTINDEYYVNTGDLALVCMDLIKARRSLHSVADDLSYIASNCHLSLDAGKNVLEINNNSNIKDFDW